MTFFCADASLNPIHPLTDSPLKPSRTGNNIFSALIPIVSVYNILTGEPASDTIGVRR